MLPFIMFTIICSVLVITGYNIYLAFTKNTQKLLSQKVKIFEIVSLIYGVILQSVAVGVFFNMSNNYFMEISSIEDYAPIASANALTIICIVLVSFAGYMLLRLCDFNKLSPIIIVLSLSSMFLFVIVSIVWAIQTIPKMNQGYVGILAVCVFPFNFYILLVTTIKRIILTWNTGVRDTERLNKMEKILLNSKRISLFAFIFLIPLLLVIIIILTLFGQAPDSIIRAWTDTAEWTFSQRIPPPRLNHDGHYLCTVAANGHKKLVKPLRVGSRLGEKIVVNRQLCIANAFEEIIEEKAPKIHKKVRAFYNKYGYPLSKHITKAYLSDIIYITMKPLEWFFLVIIYTIDTKPENRIARQYTNFTK